MIKQILEKEINSELNETESNEYTKLKQLNFKILNLNSRKKKIVIFYKCFAYKMH